MPPIDYSKWDKFVDSTADSEDEATSRGARATKSAIKVTKQARKEVAQPPPEIRQLDASIAFLQRLGDALAPVPLANNASDAVRLGQPVLLKEACSDWIATERWTWAYLADCFGDVRVCAGDWASKKRRVLLRRLLASWWPHEEAKPDGDAHLGCHTWRAFDECPELMADVQHCKVRGVREHKLKSAIDASGCFAPSRTAVCMGEAGFVPTKLYSIALARHCWVACIRGAQRWVVIPRAKAGFFDPRETSKGRRVASPRRLKAALDVDGFGGYTCILSEGDVLVVPSGCLMWCENLWASLAVRRCFVTIHNLVEFQQWLLHRNFERLSPQRQDASNASNLRSSTTSSGEQRKEKPSQEEHEVVVQGFSDSLPRSGRHDADSSATTFVVTNPVASMESVGTPDPNSCPSQVELDELD